MTGSTKVSSRRHVAHVSTLKVLSKKLSTSSTNLCSLQVISQTSISVSSEQVSVALKFNANIMLRGR